MTVNAINNRISFTSQNGYDLRKHDAGDVAVAVGSGGAAAGGAKVAAQKMGWKGFRESFGFTRVNEIADIGTKTASKTKSALRQFLINKKALADDFFKLLTNNKIGKFFKGPTGKGIAGAGGAIAALFVLIASVNEIAKTTTEVTSKKLSFNTTT